MAGDKRKGKAVDESKRKKSRQQKEWDRVLAVPDTQGQPQRGIRISEGTQSQGEQPRVSRHSSRERSKHSSSSNSSHDGQAEGTSEQSRQSHPLTGQVRTSDTRRSHPTAADTTSEENCNIGAHRESSRLTTPSSPEIHEQRLSKSISVTSVTC
jgi:hypothetical protein